MHEKKKAELTASLRASQANLVAREIRSSGSVTDVNPSKIAKATSRQAASRRSKPAIQYDFVGIAG